MVMVRACKKCRECISIYDSSFGHRKLILFEKNHGKHPLVTVDSNEAGDYINLNQKYDQLTEKKLWFNKIFWIYAVIFIILNVFFLIIDPYTLRPNFNGAISFIVVKMQTNRYQWVVDFLILPLLFGILLYFDAKKRKKTFEFNFSEYFKRYLFLSAFSILFLVCAMTIYAYGYILLINLHLVPPPF